jgi:hypothetical protein
MSKEKFGYVAMMFLILMVAVGAKNAYNHSDSIKQSSAIMGHMFNDYCKSRGGVIPMFSIEVYLDEVDTDKDTRYLTCADDSDAGILVVQDDTVVYYIPEEK